MKRKKCMAGDATCRPHNKILDPAEARQEWERQMQRSPHNKIPRGAEEIARATPSAHGEEWRHNDKQKMGKKGSKKR